jgi:hypothetical protein
MQPSPEKGAERLVDAEVADFVAQTEGKRLKAEDESYQLRGDVDLKREKQQADNRDREVRTDAEIERQGKETDVKVAAIKSETRTTRDERYFCMAIAAIGVLAAIALAFVNAGQGGEDHLGSGIGLLISGGAGFRLYRLTPKRKTQGDESRLRRDWVNFSEANSWGKDS